MSNYYHVQFGDALPQDITSALSAAAEKGKYLDVKVGTDGTRTFDVRDHSFWRHGDIGPVSRAAVELMVERSKDVQKNVEPQRFIVLPADRFNKVQKILDKFLDKFSTTEDLYEARGSSEEEYTQALGQKNMEWGGSGSDTRKRLTGDNELRLIEHLDGILGSEATQEKILVAKGSYSFEALKTEIFNREHMGGFGEGNNPFIKNSTQAKRDVLRTDIWIGGIKIDNPTENNISSEEKQTKKLEDLKRTLQEKASAQQIQLTRIQLGILSELLAQTVDKDVVLEYRNVAALLMDPGSNSLPNYIFECSKGRSVEYSFEEGKAIVKIKKRFKIQTPSERDSQGALLRQEVVLKEAEAVQTITLDLSVDPEADASTAFVTLESTRSPYRNV